ncbi:OB-fold domain-containing protein [Nocardioides sp. AE5]|uniref:Zn-ribbon domain-containing OB-fold protein n=1 Tax=Nocardioides sp. AE5 TaxID=2962573 RepID=UPI00288273A3|nr:OB-fold domain-containing protein [Nocardioides sp. AE5]MDT0202299.1 OB-fold domain-containing protein [Nocardioides sp. AE5]
MTTPAIEGWFTTGPEPALLGSECTECGNVAFPAEQEFCKNPACSSESFAQRELGRTGTVWSYTDAQYQPPAPYIPASDPYEPFTLAAVEVPEGLVILGQLAAGYSVADIKVGSPVTLVVERAWSDEDGDKTMWKWLPTEPSEERASDRGGQSGPLPTESSEAEQA